MSILKYAGSVRRFVVICFVLARQLAFNLRLRQFFAAGTPAKKTIKRYLKTRRPKVSGAEIAKQTLERLGPTFVKLGQFLSIRPDLVPPEFCEEFRKLQDQVPPFSYVEVRRQLRQELGRDPAEVFRELDATPVAAASVAQVHRGRLASGKEVAVKVQRPNVRRRMEEDILIMLFFAHVLDRIVPALRKNQLVMLVHEFSRWTDRELDFYQEGKHALQFAHCFAGYRGVKIPRVYLELSTERLLVMEFVHGLNPLEAPAKSIQRKAVARLIADSMLKQIFVDGFFHGDPHAGNILVIGRRSIAYLDFGIVGYLSQELREWTFDVLYGMARADVRRVIDSFLEICDVDTESVDVPAYRRQMNEVLAELHVCQIANIPFTHLMQEFLNTSLEFGLDVPHDFVIMSKAITTLEGTCRSLDPNLKFAQLLQPFVERYAATVPDLNAAIEQLKMGPFEMRRLKRLVFNHGTRALRLLERPTFRIEGAEFRNIVREMDKSSVNVAYGVLIGALILFSATVSHETALERWLRTMLHLPVAPFLSLASLALAVYFWLRLYLRNRTAEGRRASR
jgi:ubiquinone biosynthesis protein